MSLSRVLRVFTLVSIVGLTLNACAVTPQRGHASLPDRLADQGVVIAEVHGFEGQEVNINGRRYAYLHNRHLVLPLSPGKYTLTSISNTINDGRYINTNSLPLNREFEIKAGKVTNLGLILFVFDPKDKKKFFTMVLDNTPAAQRYLRASHPALAANLDAGDFVLAPGKYLPADKLPMVRKVVASSRGMWSRAMEPGISPTVVAGPAGLVGEYVMKDGKAVDLKILETDTLAHAVNVSRLGDRHFIAMSDGRLFLLAKGRLETVNPPTGAAPLVKARLAPGGLVVIDERMTAFWSRDNGRQWHTYAAAQLPPEESTGAIGIETDDAGFFFYTKKTKAPRVLYTDAASIAFASLPLPPEVTGIEKVVSKKAGVFVEQSENSLFKDDVLYFKAKDSSTWEPRKGPGSFCVFRFEDEVGTRLRSSCGISQKPHGSTDGGKTWQPL